ncbi:MAG: MaoC family dehydratase [Fimbriimonadaceae bacterium]
MSKMRGGDVYYFEDLEIGREYGSHQVEMTEKDILIFASYFDPQPFHTDREAASHSVFGKLVASGWHTAAVTMRLRVTGELQLAGGWVGMGVEGLKWPQPVEPGDVLHAKTVVLEKRESKSNPRRGIIRVRTQTFNQRDELVFETTSVQLVDRRV